MKNNNQKTKKVLSVKAKVFIGMSIMLVLLLVIMWLSQSVFISQIYSSVKQVETKNANTTLAQSIGEENFSSLCAEYATEYESCVVVLRKDETTFTVTENEHFLNECFIHNLPEKDSFYQKWYQEAKKNGNFYTVILNKDDAKERHTAYDAGEGNIPHGQRDSRSIVSVSVVEKDGAEYVIIFNSALMPVPATLRTIRVQLILVSVVLIVFSIILALFLSNNIASPIEKINQTAKNLSLGNYEIAFSEQEGTKEIRELAKTLNQATQELKKTEKMQKELIANISHDLRTPLTMISGYSEVMRDIPGENTPENMQVIIDETARLSSLIKDLLDFSKLQSGSVPLNIEKINLTKLIEDTIRRYEKLVEHDGYTISFVPSEEVFIKADEIRILQVIYNLINNAINYTGDDKTVTIEQIVKENTVRINVIDTGEGISKEELPLIWDRYYKIDKVHKRTYTGSGIGLSIVKNILLLHSSRFGVSSDLGKGSTFFFEFPICKD